MAEYAPRYLLHTAMPGSTSSSTTNKTSETNTTTTTKSSMTSADKDELLRLLSKSHVGMLSAHDKDMLLKLLCKERASHGGKGGKARRKRFRLKIDDDDVISQLRDATKTYYITMSKQASKCSTHEDYIRHKINAENALYETKAKMLENYVEHKYGLETVPKPKTADENTKAWGVVHRMHKRATITAESVVQRYQAKDKFLDDTKFSAVVKILDEFYKEKKTALDETNAEQRKTKLKAALTKKRTAMSSWRSEHSIAARPRRPAAATQVAFHLGEHSEFAYDDIDEEYI